jgi:hypothetical protein
VPDLADDFRCSVIASRDSNPGFVRGLSHFVKSHPFEIGQLHYDRFEPGIGSTAMTIALFQLDAMI